MSGATDNAIREDAKAGREDATRPLVYIAGPYSKPDPCANTHGAVAFADRVLEWFPGVIPVVPHLTHFWHTMSPKPYAFWLDYDLEILRRCDAIFRMYGESSGADGEVAFAQENGIPVLSSFDELRSWLRER